MKQQMQLVLPFERTGAWDGAASISFTSPIRGTIVGCYLEGDLKLIRLDIENRHIILQSPLTSESLPLSSPVFFRWKINPSQKIEMNLTRNGRGYLLIEPDSLQ